MLRNVGATVGDEARGSTFATASGFDTVGSAKDLACAASGDETARGVVLIEAVLAGAVCDVLTTMGELVCVLLEA